MSSNQIDLYDHEIAAIGPVWMKLKEEFSRKTTSLVNLAELKKRAQAEFLKIGLIVDVDTSPCIVSDAKGNTGTPVINVLGRLSEGHVVEEGHIMTDHELKGFEIRKSKTRGEDFLGQRERVNTRRPSNN